MFTYIVLPSERFHTKYEAKAQKYANVFTYSHIPSIWAPIAKQYEALREELPGMLAGFYYASERFPAHST